MNSLDLLIGEHHIQIKSESTSLLEFFNKNYQVLEDGQYTKPNMVVFLIGGYGVPFVNYNVDITNESHRITYIRSDYKIEVDHSYENATVSVHNELALKHALLNLYSSFILHHNWGLLIHSSCVSEGGKAHIFAGPSGAGKSTAARLSYPRELLSDEATLIKISNSEITVFNSPFRSELQLKEDVKPLPLASIQLLHQSLQNKRTKLKRSDGLLQLTGKVFYWAHNPFETKKILGLLHSLVKDVPVYHLHFKKDDTFWELIS
jgi:hypothetical protein